MSTFGSRPGLASPTPLPYEKCDFIMESIARVQVSLVQPHFRHILPFLYPRYCCSGCVVCLMGVAAGYNVQMFSKPKGLFCYSAWYVFFICHDCCCPGRVQHEMAQPVHELLIVVDDTADAGASSLHHGYASDSSRVFLPKRLILYSSKMIMLKDFRLLLGRPRSQKVTFGNSC